MVTPFYAVRLHLWDHLRSDQVYASLCIEERDGCMHKYCQDSGQYRKFVS